MNQHKSQYSFFIAFLLFANISFGQQKMYHGRVLDKKTKKAIEGVVVSNKTQNAFSLTDGRGVFNIAAKQGDSLKIDFVGYKSNSVKVKRTLGLSILLEDRLKDTSGIVISTHCDQKYYAQKLFLALRNQSYRPKTILKKSLFQQSHL